jgi:hypothetical protein
MLDIGLIDEEIKKLEETSRTTMNICQQLAALYTVREHFNHKKKQSVTPTTLPNIMG